MVVKGSVEAFSIRVAMLFITSQCLTPPLAFSQIQTLAPLETETKLKNVIIEDVSLNDALELIKKKEFEKAIEFCTKLISKCETNSDFYFFRAMAFQSISKNDNALADLNKALHLNPRNSAEIYYFRAVSQQALGQSELAFEDCNTAINLDPKYPGSYEKRAELYLERKQIVEAINDWSIAIELEPLALNFLERGLAYEKHGDISKAISDYDSAIKLDSENPYFFYCRAKAKRIEKLLGGADARNVSDCGLADISKAISLKPKEPVYFIVRAHIYGQLLQFSQAIKDCTSAIQLAPNDDELYSERGDLYKESKQLNNAVSDYSKAIALKPKKSGYYLRRAKVYEALSMLEKSFQDCSKAVDADPKGDGAKLGYIEKGNLFMKQGNSQNAIDEYTKAIAVKTSDEHLKNHAYFKRSKAYSNLGQHSKAVADLAKWTVGSQKDAELFYYDSAIKDHPKEAWTYAGRGEAFRTKGLNKQAIEDCTIAIALNPKFAPAYATRGLAYKKEGDEKAALSDFHKAITLDSNLAERLSKID